MKQPLVSFCIATYQRRDVLTELVEELLSVRDKRIEVVVCDDCSMDDNISKISLIEDSRLKIYVNSHNIGSAANIYEATDHGLGKYLFYLNDRDNVDPYKIPKLLDILEELDKLEVSFAICVSGYTGKPFKIFSKGEEALVRFPCRITHESGCIFRKKEWDEYKNRIWCTDERYGDYAHVIAAAKPLFITNGAEIYGDICDINRLRIDFSIIKSGYYNGRKDKRLFFTKEVMWRELTITYNYFNELKVTEDLLNEIILNRYMSNIRTSVLRFADLLRMPSNTAHYDYYPSLNPVVLFFRSITNGLYLWRRVRKLFRNRDLGIKKRIDKLTYEVFAQYFKEVFLKTEDASQIAITKRDNTIGYLRFLIDDLLGKAYHIAQYLNRLNYKKIAIYGRGVMGVGLYKVLKEEGLEISYFIDRIRGASFEDVETKLPDEDLPPVDIIFVTVVNEEDEIIARLHRRVSCPVESMKDIVFVNC